VNSNKKNRDNEHHGTEVIGLLSGEMYYWRVK